MSGRASGWGTIVAFASYNEPSHNFVRDAWMVPLINCGTSFLAGIVVFSILGYMANQKGVSVADVAEGGTGLAFVVYPEALARMPGAPIFSFRLKIIQRPAHLSIRRHRQTMRPRFGAGQRAPQAKPRPPYLYLV